MEKAVFFKDQKSLEGKEYDRLYYGNEFCERLIPSIDDIKKVIEFVKDKRVNFSFVTPYVTDKGIADLERIFEVLKTKVPGCEVIVNDWGVFRLVDRMGFNIVIGRLLNKQKKGPEIMRKFDSLSEESKKFLQSCAFDNGLNQEYAVKKGITRVELDNIFTGISSDFSKSGLKASLYYPYIYITTTRKCKLNSCDSIRGSQRQGIFACKKECTKYQFKLKHDLMPKELLQIGNTLFAYNDTLPIKLEERGIDRLVFITEPII
ncbi:MAG: hypothetical protein KJ601_02415 [Nanoarchaeota archaeon]|nr:hypothetical protein [Nanoarchaeota archaeon]MBU1704301.1 hypothetical protein [Nanoarchaeota archaeon]